jgi:hypothetical protein
MHARIVCQVVLLFAKSQARLQSTEIFWTYKLLVYCCSEFECSQVFLVDKNLGTKVADTCTYVQCMMP